MENKKKRYPGWDEDAHKRLYDHGKFKALLQRDISAPVLNTSMNYVN